MNNRYDEIPSTGAHRGQRLNIEITGSVRAQEATDPIKARKERPAKQAGDADASADRASGEKRDRQGPTGRN